MKSDGYDMEVILSNFRGFSRENQANFKIYEIYKKTFQNIFLQFLYLIYLVIYYTRNFISH